MSTAKYFYATGRRKTSAARVFLKPGKGEIEINGRKLENYIAKKSARMLLLQPFEAVNGAGKYDVCATVTGGGENGQAGAIRMGIARALILVDESFRPLLKKGGFLTRDSRMVERKKYGMSGARKRYQYSKR